VISILIADDQQDVREALRGLLADDPAFEVVALAADAEEATELARRHRPDVALVDFKMPRGGGARATAEIGAASPSTRVVAVSAYGDRQAVLEMLRAGAVGYLVKGATAREIRDTIVQCASGLGSLSPEVTGQVLATLRDELQRAATAEERERARRTRVRLALSGGVMRMHFQPVVELVSGRTVGLEALARFFSDPQQPPNVWFMEAAAVGLQQEAELAALRAARAALSRIPDDLFLAVNVGPEVLGSDALLAELATLPAPRIVLETTEHSEIEDYARLAAQLAPFRERGGRLAVDDAGAGYASLRHVLQLSPDIIKLDASLTRDIDRDRGRRTLAAGLIAFAEAMGAHIVAEGIETEAELRTLLELGVGLGQGFHLARPAPLEQIRVPRGAG